MKDTSFSVAKALAIFFMVLAHSGCPSWISGFVSMFHMPFFFICAGYFFKAAYWDNGQPFVERRIKRLYVPFVKWSVVMLCLHNVLSLTGIIPGGAASCTAGTRSSSTCGAACSICRATTT